VPLQAVIDGNFFAGFVGDMVNARSKLKCF
jgi:hypothetical protein